MRRPYLVVQEVCALYLQGLIAYRLDDVAKSSDRPLISQGPILMAVLRTVHKNQKRRRMIFDLVLRSQATPPNS
jgi:hypothetical protein